MGNSSNGNPRTGRMKGGVNGEPARFVPGRASAPVEFEPEEIAKDMGMWWKSGTGNSFVLGDEENGWSIWPEQAVVDLMREERAIAIKPRDGERLAESKRVFLWARKNRCLDEIFPALSGYRSGVYRLDSGERVLVKTSPQLIAEEEGDWSTIRALIEGQLDLSDVGEVDQTDYFYSWCKVAVEALRYGEPGQWRPGHSLILVGPAGSGKSRLQENIITPLLGGRMADPKAFLFGKDDFNGDCFAAEHLCMGEVPSSQRTIDRVELAEKIKQIVANSLQRMRLMRTEPWTVYPYWRLTISLNDDPDKLRSLPVITEDLAGKVLIFHTSKKPLPMPTSNIVEQKAFRDQLAQEMPAFIHWLMHEYEIPEELLTYPDGKDASRFGFREFHHPLVKDGLFDETPAAELLMLIDMASFDYMGQQVKLWDLPSHGQAGKCWHERAATLEQLLTGDGEWACSIEKQARSLLSHNRIAALLSRLNAHSEIGGGKRIAKGDTNAWKGWIIGPRQD